MTEATINALIGAIIGAIPPTLVAWAALRSSQKSNEKTDLVVRKVDDNTATTEATAKKTEEIHVATEHIKTTTNGTLSEVTSKLGIANTRIEEMAKQIAEMAVSRKDAQDVAMRHPPSLPMPPP